MFFKYLKVYKLVACIFFEIAKNSYFDIHTSIQIIEITKKIVLDLLKLSETILFWSQAI